MSLRFSLRYSSIQKSFFGWGLGAFRRFAIGLGGILISGRHPIGGGSKLCGFGETLLAVGGNTGGGGGGGAVTLFPFVVLCTGALGRLAMLGGGGGGGAGGPVGNTWNGMPMAAAPNVAAGDTAGWLLPLLLLLELFCASGDTLGWFETPSDWAFRDIRLAIRGDLIWDRSMPPGVYVKGCLSRRIMAFCTQAGGSAGNWACIRRAELPIVDCGGPP